MRNAILCLALACVGGVAPLRAACDCTRFPITPKACVIPCQNALIMKLSKEDLTSKLKLSESTADAVIDKREKGDASSVPKLKDEISTKQYTELKTKLDALKPADFKELASKYGTATVPDTRMVINDKVDGKTVRKQ